MSRYCYPGISRELKGIGNIQVLPSGSVYLTTPKGMRHLDSLSMRIGLAVAGPEGEQILVTRDGVHVGEVEIKKYAYARYRK